MTEEELNEKIEAAVENATKGLKKKNSELLSKLDEAKDAAKAAQKDADDAAAQKDREEKNIDAIEKRHAAELKKRDDQITSLTTEVTSYKIDGAIRENLTKHGFDQTHHDLLFDAMKAKARLDGTEAMIGDVSIEDHFATFASSDTGKRYMPAPDNGGASAQGGKPTTPSAMTKENFSLTAFMALPDAEKNAVADRLGMPELKA